jgi:yeast amino acid transporter
MAAHDDSKYARDREEGPFQSNMAAQQSDSDFDAIDPNSGVKRGLKTRHLSMMALAGIIGPGLLVGSGGALSNGGPASLLIGFGVIGIIAFRCVLVARSSGRFRH